MLANVDLILDVALNLVPGVSKGIVKILGGDLRLLCVALVAVLVPGLMVAAAQIAAVQIDWTAILFT